MMDAGKLTEELWFVRRTRVQKASGGYDFTDSIIGTPFAEVRPVDGREGEQAGRQFGSTTFLVTIYADDKPTDLTTADHIVWLTGGHVQLNIRAIRQAAPRAMFLEIVAEAGAVIQG
jgi:head-tail adaptor